MARTVLLPVNDNQGYAPDQIQTQVTLASMLEAIQAAIEEFGEDAKVVVANGQRYGAGFGSLQAMPSGEVVIGDANPDDEDYQGCIDEGHHVGSANHSWDDCLI